MILQSNNRTPTHRKNTSKLQVSFKKLTLGFQNYKDIKQAHLKNKNCQESTEYKQSKQCTFQPRLSTKKIPQVPDPKRSLKQFLQDQTKFTQQKRNKIQSLRQQISKQGQDEFKTKPSIDSVSHRISTQMSFKSGQKVFERLSKQKKITVDLEEQQGMFSPHICQRSKSLKRQKNVSNLLYEDAQRRRQKQEMKFQQLLKQQFVPQININTNNLVIKKIYSEFSELVKEQNITPLLAITAISEIFNVDLNPNKSSEQEQLCEKVLFYIADTKTQTVNTEVLWNFIQTIVNGHLINSNFNQQEQDTIIQSFSYFYSNRLTKRKKDLTPQKNNFKPKTLRSSDKLAQNHRQRTLSGINEYLQNQKVNIQITNNSVKIEDMFIIQHRKRNAQNQRKRIQKQNKQLQQCSFRPNLTLSSTSMLDSNKSRKKVNLVSQRSTKALQLKKIFKIKKKQQQIDSKNQQERFKTMYQTGGNITSKRLNTQSNKNKQNQIPKASVKDIQKSVMRVAVARKNRQLVTALNQRGYPSNVQNWQSFRKSLKKDIQKSSEKILKGYNSLNKSNNFLLNSSTLVSSKQVFS